MINEGSPEISTSGGSSGLPLRRGSGCRLVDVNGSQMLDFTASYGTCSLGYGHPAMVSGLNRQITELWQTMSDLRPHESLRHAQDVVLQAVGRAPDHEVFFVTSGSEAVELAWKLAVLQTGRHGILCFQGSFHGQAGIALQATAFTSLRSAFDIRLPVHFVPFPTPSSASVDEEILDHTIDYVESFLSNDSAGGFPVGAILVEAIQNLSGYKVPVPGLLGALRSICDRHGLLLIVDEVFTGFGRTGYWLASDAEECVPDVICVGKGMLAGVGGGACLASRQLLSLVSKSGTLPLHGSTFKGNPLACVAASTAISVMESEGLVSRAKSLEAAARSRLDEIISWSTVAGVRGRGLALGIAMRDPHSGEPAGDLATEVCRLVNERGLHVICNGYPYLNVLCICPPLVIDEVDLRWGVNLLVDTIGEVNDRVGAA